MVGEQVAFLAAPAEMAGRRIMPNIGPVAPELAELNVVPMRPVPILQHKDELVLAAVQRAHPGIVLDPDAEILELAVEAVGGEQQLQLMAPIHADVVQRAVDAVLHQVLERTAQKKDILFSVHFSGGCSATIRMGRQRQSG